MRSSGVTPVAVLTKMDLCADFAQQMDELAARMPGDLERYAVNATAAAGTRPRLACFICFPAARA